MAKSIRLPSLLRDLIFPLELQWAMVVFGSLTLLIFFCFKIPITMARLIRAKLLLQALAERIRMSFLIPLLGGQMVGFMGSMVFSIAAKSNTRAKSITSLVRFFVSTPKHASSNFLRKVSATLGALHSIRKVLRLQVLV